MIDVTTLLVLLCAALDCGVSFQLNVEAPHRLRRSNELQVSCNASHFKCLDGQCCITRTQLCNRQNDCIDGSDESNCPFSLIARKRGVFDDVSLESYGFFICKDSGRKINQWMVCDGDKDCEDASDEFDCKDLSRCENSEVECTDGSRCLLKAWLCDGRKDCEDGSDEVKCGPIVCAPHQFLCPKSQTCIPRSFVCDKHPDCLIDAADEKDCSWVSDKRNVSSVNKSAPNDLDLTTASEMSVPEQPTTTTVTLSNATAPSVHLLPSIGLALSEAEKLSSPKEMSNASSQLLAMLMPKQYRLIHMKLELTMQEREQ